ncbi:hypothetical protein [Prescottella equi]|uniref:hypothetical protein n=1 Tax=Rhodococcus hoagii TaxID=43767 RepID=UPI000D101D31|nr:hypothetical protein [Prescottella equi]AVP71331.1 hypothetical protein C7H75_24935 [Prescottella equi]MBM4469816.1 hypothetical protein [Prescottella equi]NKZ84570.1 hypothetical protein [Prescottella equi]
MGAESLSNEGLAERLAKTKRQRERLVLEGRFRTDSDRRLMEVCCRAIDELTGETRRRSE